MKFLEDNFEQLKVLCIQPTFYGCLLLVGFIGWKLNSMIHGSEIKANESLKQQLESEHRELKLREETQVVQLEPGVQREIKIVIIQTGSSSIGTESKNYDGGD